jgi:2-C-methyl-D-erythritol 4-phosphate cytidylyltransferase
LYKVDDKTILEHTVSIFLDIDYINEIIVVVSHTDIQSITEILQKMRTDYIDSSNIDTLFMTNLNEQNCNDKIFLVDDNNVNKTFPTINNKVIKMVVGGSTRSKSIKNGLSYVKEGNNIAVIHDGARPYTSKEDVIQSIEAAEIYGASCVAKSVTDTLKYIQSNGEIVSLDRRNCVAVETPQCFKIDLIKKAYDKLTDEDHFTDDTEIYAKFINSKIKFVFHTDNNSKITSLQDIYDYRNKLLYDSTNLNVNKNILKEDELVIGDQIGNNEKDELKKIFCSLCNIISYPQTA